MRVRFRNPAPDAYTSEEAKYVAPGQTFLSTEKHYDVHAVSVYDGVVFVQVVDDNRTPVFDPRALFDVIDTRVPEDWICNVFSEGLVQLVLGPRFVAKDLASYDGMIDHRGPQVDEFWKRVDSTPQPLK